MAEPHAALNRYARIAGAVYLVTILTNIAKLALVDPLLDVPGDRMATLANIAERVGLYRVGIAYEAAMFALVVLLALSLYVILREVNRTLALLALGWRLTEAAIGAATVLLGLAVVAALGEGGGGAGNLAGALIEARTQGYGLVILALSLGTVVFCALFWKSRMIPRWLSGFGIVAFALMIPVALIGLAAPALAAPLFLVAGPLTILFELVIGGWLLVRGVPAR